jgi:hypothetical protein
MKPLFLGVLFSTAALYAALPSRQVGVIRNPNHQLRHEHNHRGSVIAVTTNNTYAIGVPRGQSPFGVECGQVQVGSNLMTCPGYLPGAEFGSSLAWAGSTRLVIGAPHAAYLGASLNGQVFLYSSFGPNSSPYATVTSPVLEGFERFGRAVAANNTRLAISALGIGTAAASTGIVHVYSISGTAAPVLLFSIPNPTPAAGDDFGKALTISGDRLYIADPGENERGGQVWVHDLASATPELPVLIIPSPLAATEKEAFGHALASEGSKLVVGAPESLGLNGRAYVFDLASGTPATPVVSLVNPDPFIWEAFGSSVAIRGTLAAVGCPSDITDMGNFIGSVYVYDLISATPAVANQRLSSPTGQPGGSFGSAVAFGRQNSTAEVLVGAPGMNLDAPASGATYFYDVNVYGPSPTASLRGDVSHIYFQEFGKLAQVTGDWLIIAEGRHLFGFDLSAGIPEQPSFIRECVNFNAGQHKVTALAAEGDRLVVATGGEGTLRNQVHVLSLSDPQAPWLTISAASSFSTIGSRLVLRDGYLAVSLDTSQILVFNLAGATPTTPLITLTAASSVLGFDLEWPRLAVGIASGARDARVYDLSSATPTTPVHVFAPAVATGGGCRVFLRGGKLLVDHLNVSSGTQLYDLSIATPVAMPIVLESTDLQLQGRGAVRTFSGTSLYAVLPMSSRTTGPDHLFAQVFDLSSSTPSLPQAGISAKPWQLLNDLASEVSLAHRGNLVIAGHAVQNNPDGFRSATGAVTLHAPAFPQLSMLTTGENPVLSGQQFDLGVIAYEEPTPLSLILRNTGADPLIIYSAGDVPSGVSPMSLVPQPTFPLTIPPASQIVFTGVKKGSSFGPFNETLRLFTNSENAAVFSLGFIGQCVTAQEQWRHRHFGVLTSTGMAADNSDPDGDGYSNVMEFLTGTLPLNPGSRVEVRVENDPLVPAQKRLSVLPAPPVRTSTLPLYTYRFEATNDLAGPWQTLWEGLFFEVPSSLPDPESATTNARFYRLKVIWYW